MEMKLETLPDYPVAYVRRTGPYGPDNARAMEALKGWAGEAGLLEEGLLLGAVWDDPGTTPPEQCRYDACLVTADAASGGAGPEHCVLAGGRCAVFPLRHTAEAMGEAWASVFPELARRGLSPDPDRPVLERYPAELVRQGRCELCVPVL